jgi:hypothetical protein
MSARKKYRPRQALTMPAPYRTTKTADTGLSLKSRAAVDAVASGAGTAQDLAGVETDLAIAAELQRIAAKSPNDHDVSPEAIQALGVELLGIASFLREVRQRHRETGRIGCTAHQRSALMRFADLCDEMRQAIPRRLWLMAYRHLLGSPSIEVQELESA